MLSANDIKERKFEKAAFGYKQEEIDDFLQELISEFEGIDLERDDLHAKIQILADKVREYRQDEDALKDALLGAQKQGHQVITEAQEKADAIIADAKAQAQALIDEATVQHESAMEKNRIEIEREKKNLLDAKKQVSDFKKTLFDMYKSHLEMISAMPEIDDSEYEKESAASAAAMKPRYQETRGSSGTEAESGAQEHYELPKPDPFATSSFSARTVKGVYDSRFTDLQFGQNNEQTAAPAAEKEGV